MTPLRYVLLSIFIACTFGAKTAKMANREAIEELAEEEDFRAAAMMCREFTLQNPDADANDFVLCSHYWMKIGRFGEAVVQAEAALRKDSEYRPAINIRAKLRKLIEGDKTATLKHEDKVGAWFQPNTLTFPHSNLEFTLPTRDRQAFYELLASDEFYTKFFEQQPALIHTGGAFDGVLTWDDIDAEMYGLSLPEIIVNNPNVYFLAGQLYGDIRHPGHGALEDSVDSDEIRTQLADNRTAVMNSATNWWSKIAEVNVNVSRVFNLPSNTNVYITNPDVLDSMNPHTDIQDTLIFQVEGRKRWQVWSVEDYKLPIANDDIVGKTQETLVDRSTLGTPIIDTVLVPGDILYLPRGTVHATSTVVPPSMEYPKVPSIHLTVGLEVLWEGGIDYTWAAFLGGQRGSNLNTKSIWSQAWVRGLNELMLVDSRYREAIHRDISDPFTEKLDPAVWKENTRELLYTLTDHLVEDNRLLDALENEQKRGLNRWNNFLSLMIKKDPHRWDGVEEYLAKQRRLHLKDEL